MKDFQEKRVYTRSDHYTGSPVEGLLVAGEKHIPFGEATLVNHSDGGVQIVVTSANTLRVGDTLLINVRLSEAPGEREVVGQIVWLLHENDTDRMGIEYDEPLTGISYFF